MVRFKVAVEDKDYASVYIRDVETVVEAIEKSICNFINLKHVYCMTSLLCVSFLILKVVQN